MTVEYSYDFIPSWIPDETIANCELRNCEMKRPLKNINTESYQLMAEGSMLVA
jgi:hypothetical protein